ncbi:MAG: aminotransferase class I/II-fold pyridoxal phosphate-dependent enzyme [Lachnospiraceae bacterium]|nr:aminotransferase class I/II-fold pyridoxal phosphate-dependent enzyme [Lachnospiraceae bacterium]
MEAEKREISHFYLRKDEGFALTKERAEQLCEKIRKFAPDLFFLTNPSNPVGRLTEPEITMMLAKTCEETGTTMVVDECFIELTQEPEEYTMTKHLSELTNVIVLRAFTKSFAIPGIRLGYLLCGDEKIAKKILLQLPEWNVSLVAQRAGIVAMEQDGHLEASRIFIRSQRGFLEKGLQNLGAKVFPSDANFLLFQWKDDTLYSKLLGQGILIRECSDFQGLGPDYYRIAVKNRMENEELLRRLR